MSDEFARYMLQLWLQSDMASPKNSLAFEENEKISEISSKDHNAELKMRPVSSCQMGGVLKNSKRMFDFNIC
jgi:hypothetical protein